MKKSKIYNKNLSNNLNNKLINSRTIMKNLKKFICLKNMKNKI